MDIGGEELKGELGDLLLNIVFQSQICQEKGEFNIDGVIEKLYDKLVRRHPHIFGDQNKLEQMLRKYPRVVKNSEIIHAPDVIKGTDKVAEVIRRVYHNESVNSLFS